MHNDISHPAMRRVRERSSERDTFVTSNHRRAPGARAATIPVAVGAAESRLAVQSAFSCAQRPHSRPGQRGACCVTVEIPAPRRSAVGRVDWFSHLARRYHRFRCQLLSPVYKRANFDSLAHDPPHLVMPIPLVIRARHGRVEVKIFLVAFV